jgi:tetratricopeptide (TPR) repeat protein
MRLFGLSLLAATVLGCATITVLLVYVARREPKMLVLVLGIFGGMTAVLGWITYREWTRAQPLEVSFQPAFSMPAIMEQLRNELFAHSDMSLRLATDGPVQKIDNAQVCGDFAEAERLLNEQLQKSPLDLFLHIKRWEILVATGRLREAAEHLSSIRSSFQLSSGANTFFMAEELALRAKAGEHGNVRKACEEFLRGNASLAEKTWALDRLACLPIMEDIRDYLDEAAFWSRKALELSPNDLTLKGTLGSLLVEQDRLDEGEVLLREVFESSTSDFDYGICAFYLALVAKRRGNERESTRLARRAKRTVPEPWLLSRISEEIEVN